MASSSTQAAMATLAVDDAEQVDSGVELRPVPQAARPRRSLFHVVCLNSRPSEPAGETPTA